MKGAAGVCAPPKSGLTLDRVQVGRHWPARRSPGEGGAEDQWWWEERSWQEAALRRSPLLKTLSGRGWDSSYCKKVKVEVSLFTFNFCCVNCCNTSQLLLLTGSRLLKLLKTTKCISTRIFVYLFYSTFSCCKSAKYNSNIIKNGTGICLWTLLQDIFVKAKA